MTMMMMIMIVAVEEGVVAIEVVVEEGKMTMMTD